MEKVPLGRSDLRVSPICLGTMTFGEEQVDAHTSHRNLNHALESGIDFIDTAEMYPVPPSAGVCGATESIIGDGLRKRPRRARFVLATQAAARCSATNGCATALPT
jgi:aryl-alcohol dehydrogenase-like predicted oxidoreductase